VGKVTRKRRVDAENRQVLEVETWVDLFTAEYFDVLIWTPKTLETGVAPPTTEPEPTTTTIDDGLMDPGESTGASDAGESGVGGATTAGESGAGGT
jgi:hypothetical protein